MTNHILVTMTFDDLEKVKATARREGANEAFEKAKWKINTMSEVLERSEVILAIHALKDTIT